MLKIRFNVIVKDERVRKKMSEEWNVLRIKEIHSGEPKVNGNDS